MPIKLTVALLLLCAPIASANVYTTNGTGGGSCAAGTTFVGGVAPSTSGGDQVLMANGDNLDVPVGTTCRLGTSPTNDSGAVALGEVTTSTGTGTLTVEGTFIWSGPVRLANATATFAAGSTLTYDATAAATPATALYTFQVGLAANQTNAKILFNGSSSSCAFTASVTHALTGASCVTVNSASNIASGGFGGVSTNFADSGRITGTWVALSYQGVSAGQFDSIRLSTSIAAFSLKNFTMDHCGTILSNSAIGATSVLDIEQGIVTNNVNSANRWTQITNNVAMTTGTRIISNVIHRDSMTWMDGVATVNNGLTYTENLGEVLGPTLLAQWNFDNGQPHALFANNLLYGFTNFAQPSAGTITNLHVFDACNPGTPCLNMHPVQFRVGQTNTLFTGGWYEGENDITSDMLEPTADATVSGVTLTVTQSNFAPSSSGESIGSMVNNSSGTTQTNLKIIFTQNTAVVSGTPTPAGPTYGVGGEGATTNIPASAWSMFNNNYWRPVSGGGLAAQSTVTGGSGATVAAGAFSVANSNNADNIIGSIYGSPSSQFAVPPGAIDIAVSSRFVDSGRGFMFYATDAAGLNHAIGTTWATATSYAVNDVRSNSVSGYYGARTINYRCIQAHTSGSTNMPGSLTSGNTWHQFWIPDTLYYMEVSTLAGAHAVAGLDAYEKAGMDFKNPALHNTGIGGVNIGAGNFVPTAIPFTQIF
jgi:hypothetical protein